MNTIPSESDSNAILDRLLSGAGLHRDAQLAALLGVSPQAVSQARRKRKIPEGWVVKVSQQCGLSMDWLMFGKGDESTPVASHAPVASSTSQASTPAGAAVPDLDLLCIPLVAASLSAGVGSLQTEADVLDYFAFRSDWLCRKGNPDKMVLMKVYGDSMEPEICHGDMALIDQSKQQIYPHTIYAVGVNEEIYIKQIETLPGHRMLLRSLNERYEPIEVDLRGDMAESVRRDGGPLGAEPKLDRFPGCGQRSGRGKLVAVVAVGSQLARRIGELERDATAVAFAPHLRADGPAVQPSRGVPARSRTPCETPFRKSSTSSQLDAVMTRMVSPSFQFQWERMFSHSSCTSFQFRTSAFSSAWTAIWIRGAGSQAICA